MRYGVLQCKGEAYPGGAVRCRGNAEQSDSLRSKGTAMQVMAEQRKCIDWLGMAMAKLCGAKQWNGKATQGEAREKRWAAKLRVEREDVILDEDRH